MSVKLKIKSKHLSEESKIIRFEEEKLKLKFRYNIRKHKAAGHNDAYILYTDPEYELWKSLRHHRTYDVRNENRATLLARAYISGKPYRTVEQKRKYEKEHIFANVIVPRVANMVARYDNKHSDDREWDKTRYKPTKQLLDKIIAWIRQS